MSEDEKKKMEWAQRNPGAEQDRKVRDWYGQEGGRKGNVGHLGDIAGGAMRLARYQRSPEARRKRLAADFKEERDVAMQEGRDRGKDLFGGAALGRLPKNQERSSEVNALISGRQGIADTAGVRSADVESVLGQRRAALEGFTPEERAALESQTMSEIARSEAGAMRGLRGAQAASGVRGGAAAAQQARMLSEAQKQRAAQAQNLFLTEQAQKRAAVGELESSARAAETEEFGRKSDAQSALEQMTMGARGEESQRQIFNLGQKGREQFGQLATEMGYGSLGAAESAAAGQVATGMGAQDQMAQLAALSGKGKK